MKYKYQLITIGTTGDLSDKVLNLFFEQTKELKLDKDAFIIIDETNYSNDSKARLTIFISLVESYSNPFWFSNTFGISIPKQLSL